MLKLCQIRKDYEVGDSVVHALKGIDLEFRENEFVAILGHSGCGKTTLLNIIGGLDQYSSGDLIINNKSTKRFTDADWDAYRNHSIGFVFQSYNLIPHQTVLSNVELALTLSGVGPSERRQRAVEALEKVGLGDQLNKKPSQMSGGQMQRVAIARALVNNPDILLADEPTGALDTETSVQIMDLLKEISRDKLIIMVTHNPELALDYASRIIRLKDGVITDDSDPYDSGTGDTAVSERTARKDRTSMSFFTALSLSTNNLLTKKARTILTAFAGSIGIIGIALIMSLSNGIQNYIDKVQEDTLSSYPITIQAESVDMTSMMTSLMGVQAEAEENQHEKDAVYSSTILYDMMNSMVSAEKQTNNLKAFKRYIENTDVEIASHISSIQYSYDMDMNVYAEDTDGNIVKTDVTELMQRAMSATFGGDYSTYFSTFGSAYNMMNAWQEMLPGENGEPVNPLIRSSTTCSTASGRRSMTRSCWSSTRTTRSRTWCSTPSASNPAAISRRTWRPLSTRKTSSTELESWSYEDICKMDFRYIYPADQFQYDEENEEYISVADGDIGLRTLYNNGMPIRMVGIIRQKEDVNTGMIPAGAVAYTHKLVEYVVQPGREEGAGRAPACRPGDGCAQRSALPGRERRSHGTKPRKIEAAKDYIPKCGRKTARRALCGVYDGSG